jgi:hypothetical protein
MDAMRRLPTAHLANVHLGPIVLQQSKTERRQKSRKSSVQTRCASRATSETKLPRIHLGDALNVRLLGSDRMLR